MRIVLAIFFATTIFCAANGPSIVSKVVHEVQYMNRVVLPAAERAAQGR